MNEVAARARASAEGAYAKAAYVKKQQEIKKESARLDLEKATLQAEIEVLESEKEAAAAQVKMMTFTVGEAQSHPKWSNRGQKSMCKHSSTLKA